MLITVVAIEGCLRDQSPLIPCVVKFNRPLSFWNVLCTWLQSKRCPCWTESTQAEQASTRRCESTLLSRCPRAATVRILGDRKRQYNTLSNVSQVRPKPMPASTNNYTKENLATPRHATSMFLQPNMSGTPLVLPAQNIDVFQDREHSAIMSHECGPMKGMLGRVPRVPSTRYVATAQYIPQSADESYDTREDQSRSARQHDHVYEHMPMLLRVDLAACQWCLGCAVRIHRPARRGLKCASNTGRTHVPLKDPLGKVSHHPFRMRAVSLPI